MHRIVANLALMETEVVDRGQVPLDGGTAFGPAVGSKGVSMPRMLPLGHTARPHTFEFERVAGRLGHRR